MKFPVLYKRTELGQIQTWKICVDGNGGFWTEEGIKDGTITIGKPTICTPKNESKANATTATTQALKEAQARWTKQCEKGYTESIDDVDTAVKFFKPILCKSYTDYKDTVDFNKGIYVQPKLDGMRCICKKDGMWSRNGKPIVSAPHIFEALKPLFDKDDTLIFDGELYTNKFKNDFNSIISLVKKSKPTEQDLQDSKNNIEYWIYDLPSCKEVFSKRNKELKRLIDERTDSIVYLETHKVTNIEEMNQLYGKWLEVGYEGQIIRFDALYVNKRSDKILKRKEHQDSEYTIVDVGEGLGNRSNTLGFVVCQLPERSDTFKSNIKGTFEYVAQLWKDRKSLIGKVATVKYFNLTPDGVPRFPYVIGIRDYE